MYRPNWKVIQNTSNYWVKILPMYNKLIICIFKNKNNLKESVFVIWIINQRHSPNLLFKILPQDLKTNNNLLIVKIKYFYSNKK